jgi:rhodanese-related sulfurtransferase
MTPIVGPRSALAAAAVLLLALAGCGSDGDDSDSGDSGDSGDRTVPAAEVDLVAPDEFAERMTDPDAVVVNVHVPYEGEIAGTHLFVPFDEIASSTVLPADHERPLLIYCRTGNMSATAGADLIDAGYSDVTDLDGGMIAWQATGRSIDDVPDHADGPG